MEPRALSGFEPTGVEYNLLHDRMATKAGHNILFIHMDVNLKQKRTQLFPVVTVDLYRRGEM